MTSTFIPEDDAVYFKFSNEPFAYGRDIGDNTHLNFSADDEIIGVEFLFISDGVDLTGIPEKIQSLILPELEQHGVKAYA